VLPTSSTRSRQRAGGETIDLPLLTDGLEAEREQGITIDVAYRYFATPKRKFIIADAPGHEQYTRNMVTAASAAMPPWCWSTRPSSTWQSPGLELLPQTRRHTLLANLLRVPSIVFAVNKLDAVLPVEPYLDNRIGGALIVVDPTTNRTSGALLVKAA
jgi:sulfate adenylyltransferase subunit 1